MRLLMSVLTAFACLTSLAWAGPGSDLADLATGLETEAQERQGALTTRAGQTQPPLPQDDLFLEQLERFAVDAARLSRHVEETGGPGDLRCIFRGMAEDSQRHLEHLLTEQSGSDRARTYQDLAGLMSDARLIAPDADES